mgnify:CR=1 FL=1
MTALNFRNVLVLLGIIVTSAGLIYFSVEFVDLISEWGRVLSLLLFGVLFVALGFYFDAQPESSELVATRGWRWLRVDNALYLLGAVTSFGSVIAFFAVDEIDRVWKVLIVIGLGLGLILAAGRFVSRRHAPPPQP